VERNTWRKSDIITGIIEADKDSERTFEANEFESFPLIELK
jgi:hypothetical protein